VGVIDVAQLAVVLPTGRTLFSNVSFRVGDGAKVALVGANGAGKTTLLRIIAGDQQATAGTVTITGGAQAVARAGARRDAQDRAVCLP
jgi:ATPase subunit of ABC transporter with duplicated ATPase domains